MKNLVIRADASSTIGIGHVMRCLALAQEWNDSIGNVSVIMRCSSKCLDKRLYNEKIATFFLDPAIPQNSKQDSIFCVDIAKKNGATWIVIDGYQFDFLYLKKLKDAGLKTLVIDDNGLAGPYADIILNQNAYAKPAIYKEISPNCRLLMGPSYALIRREFRRAVPVKRIIPEHAKKILITAGGGDSGNITGLACQTRDISRVPSPGSNKYLFCMFRNDPFYRYGSPEFSSN